MAEPGRSSNDQNIIRFTADDEHMRTAVGHRWGGAICITEATKGVALYGQYLPLPSGTYKAILQFRRNVTCCGSAVMDVCAKSGNRILARKFAEIRSPLTE